MTDTVVLAWVHFNTAPPELYLATATDGSEKELVSQSAGASLGDVAGQVVNAISVQAGDGSILDYVQITGSDGAQVINVKGGERSPAQSAYGNKNACITDIAIPVVRGMTLVVKTTD
jgi:hypothetical protein